MHLTPPRMVGFVGIVTTRMLLDPPCLEVSCLSFAEAKMNSRCLEWRSLGNVPNLGMLSTCSMDKEDIIPLNPREWLFVSWSGGCVKGIVHLCVKFELLVGYSLCFSQQNGIL